MLYNLIKNENFHHDSGHKSTLSTLFFVCFFWGWARNGKRGDEKPYARLKIRHIERLVHDARVQKMRAQGMDEPHTYH